MDFGDILNKWEEQNNNEVYDKGTEDGNKRKNAAEKRRRLRNKKPDAQIDIHGLTRDEAWDKLEQFFNESKANGYEKLFIIHGKGNHSTGEPVLNRTVRDFIERCPFAGESGQGKASSGGEGATWVLLKDAPESE
ncbi:MAG: Smr/MutS family protein [Treponema sp.]|jgi:DNA-nicking Smr family endonuclease|nr:Smr/MutS family protein [Treponema sp.]